MARVLWHVTMSLDGSIAPTDDSTEWMFGHGKPGPIGREVMERTGAILSGRRGFDLGNRTGARARAIYGGAWSGPVFVLTHRLDESADEPQLTFLHCDVGSAVAIARDAAGTRDIGVFGANVARQCLEAALPDEIVVHLVPVLLGEGVRLLDGAFSSPIRLRKTRCENPGQITDLSFDVLRETDLEKGLATPDGRA